MFKQMTTFMVRTDVRPIAGRTKFCWVIVGVETGVNNGTSSCFVGVVFGVKECF